MGTGTGFGTGPVQIAQTVARACANRSATRKVASSASRAGSDTNPPHKVVDVTRFPVDACCLKMSYVSVGVWICRS